MGTDADCLKCETGHQWWPCNENALCACTLQWLFMTGNSQSSYPEAFRNCADFKLVDESVGPAPVTGTTTFGTTTSKSASATVTTATTTTVSQTASPTHAPTLEPTPEPEPEPEPQPTHAPTHAPSSGQICKASPGLNRGVTDADCLKCETGYQWWPCNENALCSCSTGFVQGAASYVAGRKERTSKRKQEFLGTDDMMIQLTSKWQPRKEADEENGMMNQEL